ncbi:type II toxin-antitoxin system RelB/DinJ family antitoxin [Companilactobacillus ginsenosidimutans]|uniref:Damage-inducible protein J n=1 Tax=Companilactobacillus ginsenosidimutans TaxID=1007676 RepID=A0A0H4QJQ5_9LACO|nr:type II toxin-antitoxin system RelB/DinJ family antitoxin [Companilactobacillus ginsenosidimutans]AKP67271.1 hypothetical protein ABM34_06770 [Companilactobacillus ginsenosidimutans]
MEKDIAISFKANKKEKDEAAKIFNDLGLNLSSALNIFLKKSIAVGGLPFDLRNESLIPKYELIKRMKEIEDGDTVTRTINIKK